MELMAASDNVLRGGLTPKHIDVPELLRVLDPTPGPAPVVRADDLGARHLPLRDTRPDFALTRVEVASSEPTAVPISGVAIALVTAGRWS